MLQLVAATYRLGQRGEASAGRGISATSRLVGLAHFDCSTCDEQDERGCSLPGEEREALSPTRIDDTGEDEHDLVMTCPAGLRLREPILARAVGVYQELKVCGGPAGYYEQKPAKLPPRVAWFYLAFSAAEERFLSALRAATSECAREAAEAARGLRGNS